MPEDNEMVITINDACHQQRFKGLSFDYSFVWGDESVTSMSDATNNSPAGISSEYSNVVCDTVRPNLDGVDSDGVMNRPQWIIELNQCNMESNMQHENLTEYHMYWNQNPLPGDVIFGLMDQVKITCQAKHFMEHLNEAVTIEYVEVEPMEFEFKVENYVSLEIRKADQGASLPIAAVAYPIKPLSYTPATSANIGDHMELALVDGLDESEDGMFDLYAISIANCWMGKTETLNEEEDLVLWSEFCPAFTSWVGPESSATGTGTGYLKETWDQASSLHSIHFRQVNFPDSTTVYFHCELKVCKNSEETTCSTTELDSDEPVTCGSNNYSGPSSRRKRESQTLKTISVSTQIAIGGN